MKTPGKKKKEETEKKLFQKVNQMKQGKSLSN